MMSEVAVIVGIYIGALERAYSPVDWPLITFPKTLANEATFFLLVPSLGL